MVVDFIVRVMTGFVFLVGLCLLYNAIKEFGRSIGEFFVSVFWLVIAIIICWGAGDLFIRIFPGIAK